MCGIIGIWAKNNVGKEAIPLLSHALLSLKHRGPDHQDCKLYSKCGLGHTRLSIIDTDERSNQPFVSEDGRFTLVFNGEIYNYLSLKEGLVAQGTNFSTSSDTEVLFHLLMLEGEHALKKLNGFFAFAFYDNQNDTLLLARDRMGIKPLYVYEDANCVVFTSELHSFNEMQLPLSIDKSALNYYFGLTYLTENKTVYNDVLKLNPGELILFKDGAKRKVNYANIFVEKSDLNYLDATKKLTELITESVSARMVSDVPLGSFLSGGLDSSIIAALAVKINPKLKTFSIGFDHPYFNESNYADEVAQYIGSDHFKIILTQKDFKSNFSAFLDTIDEPFADSSAFAVYLLSKRVKGEVSVALSGDGADELFGGYRKHFAEFKIRKMSASKKVLLKIAAGGLKPFRSNRSDRWGELNRKVQKLNKGLALDHQSRYIKWCQFIDAGEREKLLLQDFESISNPFTELDWEDLNSVLLADQLMVLPNDMLKKVDLMSMANSLEVRTPFLDASVVDFANSLPAFYKINENGGKRILKDAFKEMLPESVINRPKKGFEIPIKEWLNDELDAILDGPLFKAEYLENQGLFEPGYIKKIRSEWSQPNFGDKIYMVWALIVFQHWWSRNRTSD